jgi:hypothetical protein
MSNDKPASYDLHGTHTITPGCPIDCLKAVLSGMAFNRLARAYLAPFDPPATVGDVVKLYREHRLGEISGLGRRRIGEIEVGLVVAGFVASEHNPST